MRTSLKVLLALFGTLATLALLNLPSQPASTFLAASDPVLSQFNSFLSSHNKNYLTKAEFNARLAIFKENVAYIQAHNSSDFDLGINQFADWSESELARLASLQEMPASETEQPLQSALTSPASVDWRTQGAVTSVKN